MVDNTITKMSFLLDNGFHYEWSREIFYNDTTKTIFSSEIIEKKDLEWLKKKIGWKFHFLRKPPQETKDNILKGIGYLESKKGSE